ncbi:low molecular weight phosphatase family protein [Sinomonas gamaensis]|uniref:arsenate reductase/protein-tyrosine-phosphatase family protein n=1 Tax=Sinomonas gamaensis TaxID=2565624 RepID=UPI001109362F
MVGRDLRVLFVCEGNLCRSPLAEQLLRARMSGYPVIVSSAGLAAMDGLPMPEEAAELCRRYGGNPEGHRSRLLTEAHLREADLVLTATRAQRGSAVQMMPRASRRTFTIHEFGRLLSFMSDEERRHDGEPQDLVERVRSIRGLAPPPENHEQDDLQDPYKRSNEIYELVGSQLDSDIRLISQKILSGWTGRRP